MKALVLGYIGRTSVEMADFCAKALRRLGHDAATYTYNDRKASSRIPALFPIERVLCEWHLWFVMQRMRPDFLLVVKGDQIRPSFLSAVRHRFRIPIVNYWIDDPHAFKTSSRLSPHYDLFCTNSRSCVDRHYASGCRNVIYLSFGYEPSLHRRLSTTPEESKHFGSDVSFSGTLTDQRLDTLSVLSAFDMKVWSPRIYSHIGDFYTITSHPVPDDHPLFPRIAGEPVWGEAMVKVFNASKIVLNVHTQNAPTMRDFEATACGSFLLTDLVDGLSEFFDIGKDIVCFKNKEELPGLVEYYLSHDAERARIAHNGYDRTHRDHDYASRMERICDEVEKLTQSARGGVQL